MTPEKFSAIFTEIQKNAHAYLNRTEKWYTGGLAISEIDEFGISADYLTTCMGCSDHDHKWLSFREIGIDIDTLLTK